MELGVYFGEKCRMELADSHFKLHKEEEHNLTFLQDVMSHLTTIARITTLGLSIYIVKLSLPPPEGGLSLTSWHVILYTVGWTSLMLEGILFIPKEGISTSRLPLKVRVILHWIVLVIATGFIIAGFTVIVINRARLDGNHFSTDHGLSGVVATVLAYVCFLNGIPAFFSKQLRKIIKPNLTKLFHSLVAIATVLCGAVATVTGFYTRWFISRSTTTMHTVCYTLIVMMTCWMLLKPVINSAVRLKNIFS